ncbi:lipoate--protein ligase [Enterococcus sp. BWB1-3]|uniref:lipoate--protein ligase n=1 Tax=unclassified Enterococcus TaxID=2608891 RepID=UPI001924DD04|nr:MULTISPECIES: lipoate--protein ligase [unclassified Enterococcus]MBL1228827.1 lipoate--protein ligase [Enterococcus sp. BWB1-3]MCB5951631.1 lipoate--protein ligase [Enterococcus sp. BWT-B8]MCB5954723.1 lipoate--protein ligase [Enterococcus sp. CWB-B31]
MYHIRLESRDIRENLAAEHYLLNHFNLKDSLVLFYIQTPSVIIGRNQNALSEIDMSYAEKKNIIITRRQSGGGAVYDDLGNVSFSFIMDAKDHEFGDFKTFTKPILKALHRMGAVGAEMNGRNDLFIDGKKFSGNAMYKKGQKMFMHGTLMFDVDMEEMVSVLDVSQKKIEAKGTKSVRSHVTNIKPYLYKAYQNLTTEEFRDQLLLQLFEVERIADLEQWSYRLTQKDKDKIQNLVQDIYGNEQWIYGEAPKYTIEKEEKFPGGMLELKFSVEKEVLTHLRIYGDYFNQRDTKEIEELLIGSLYTKAAIEERLKEISFEDYFTNITLQNFVQLLTSR